MEVLAKHRYLRSSPRKVRLLLPAVRGRAAAEALAYLRLAPQAAAVPLAKVIKSAVANAEHNHSLDPGNLVISRATVDEGPSLKRFRAGARGRSSPYERRTAHLTVVLTAVGAAKPSAVKAAAQRVKSVRPKRQAAASSGTTGAKSSGQAPKAPSVAEATPKPRASKGTTADPAAVRPRRTTHQTGRDSLTRKDTKGSK